MLLTRWLILVACYSLSASAGISFHEKQARVDSLMRFKDKFKGLDVYAYQRELEYEKAGLNLDNRIQNETNLLAEQLRLQIKSSYEKSFKEYGSHEQAYQEVRNRMIEDLENADPGMKEELKTFALDTLDQVQKGSVSSEIELKIVSQNVKKGILDRQKYLSLDYSAPDPDDKDKEKAKKAKEEEERKKAEQFEEEQPLGGDPIFPTRNSSKDSDKREFKSKEELLESLLSDRESTRWVSKSNQTVRVGDMTKTESKIAMQLKVSFLGVQSAVGPYITFKREYTSYAIIMAEGLNPVILSDGNFDIMKRDRSNKASKKNGKFERRFVSFTCEGELNFKTEQGLEGSISAGIGIEGSASGLIGKEYSNNVSLASRRITLPEYVAGQTVTVKFLSEFCHNDFWHAPFSDSLTIEKSLDLLMKNLVSTLTYSSSKTKCVIDDHCYDWYARNLWRSNTNIAKCVQESNRDGFMACRLRGLEGENCALFDSVGKRISDGMFEVQCDTGLQCAKVSEGGWFKGWDLYRYPKGQCKKAKRK